MQARSKETGEMPLAEDLQKPQAGPPHLQGLGDRRRRQRVEAGEAELPGAGMRRVWAVGMVVAGLLAFAPPAGAFIYWGDYANGRIGRAANDGSSIEPNFITGLGSPA